MLEDEPLLVWSSLWKGQPSRKFCITHMAILAKLFLFLLISVNGWALSFSWPMFIRQPRSVHPEPADDIQFDIPDIVVPDYPYAIKSVKLEAFKVRNRTAKESPKWVSVGYPEIVGAGENGRRIFLFTDEYITVQIKLLNDNQKKMLLKKAKSQYPNQNILEENIIPLPLGQFACEIMFRTNGQTHVIRGSAYDLHQNPILLQFPLHEGNAKRMAFEKRLLNRDQSLFLKCELAAAGKQEKINSLKITGDQFQEIRLADKLLGPANETYVTREKMSQVSQEIKRRMHIEESYEIENESFSEEFIQNILDGSGAGFEWIPIDDALNKSSKYGLSFNGRDLSPNEIKRELENVLQVKKDGSKERIVAQRGQSESSGDSFGISGGVSAYGFGVNYGFNQSSQRANSSLSVDDQLRELNHHSKSSIKWEREGTRIMPKSLYLTKVTRMTLSQQMAFTRIKKRMNNAKYLRKYGIDTRDFGSAQEQPNLAANLMLIQKDLIEVKENVSRLNIRNECQTRTSTVYDGPFVAWRTDDEHMSLASLNCGKGSWFISAIEWKMVDGPHGIKFAVAKIHCCRQIFQVTQAGK